MYAPVTEFTEAGFSRGWSPAGTNREDAMLGDYLPVLILMIVAVCFAAGAIILSYFVGTKKPTDRKLAPYECGLESPGAPHERLPIRFYLVAMLFILFDIELIFFYPWAVAFNRMQPRSFLLVEMLVFILILLVGYVYAWRKGALDWE